METVATTQPELTGPTPEEEPRKSPALAALLSIVPGLGQFYAGARIRGVALFAIIILQAGIVLWKYFSQGAIDLNLTIILLALIGLLYLWNIWDAARTARRRPLPLIYAFLVTAVATYAIGFVVTEINVVKFLTEFTDVAPILRQIVYPWNAAFEREIAITEAETFIDVPCTDSTRAVAELVAGEPSISVSPTCGEATSLSTPGTPVTITGTGFRPGEEVTVWWADDFGQTFRPYQGGYIRDNANAEGAFEVELLTPQYLLENPQTVQGPHTVYVRQEREVGPLKPSQNLVLAFDKMIDTVFLGLMATTMGVIFAVPVSFLAARNLMSTSPLTMAIYFIVRTILNIIRSVEPIIWAVMFILWVGLGPFAGVLALMFHTVAALGKLYSESIESIDPGPIEAIQATGANRLQTIMYAIVPQIVPPFVSFTFYRWDINVRMSTIIGIVGGGGIGFLLIQWIRLTDYDAAGIAVWMIAVVVATLDYVSSQIRADFV
jgi:phosphonate transport system permease protein